MTLRPEQSSRSRAGRGGLVVVSGLPATGKTTLSRRLAVDLPGVRIARDELRSEVFGDLMGSWQPRPGQPPIPELLDRILVQVGRAVLDGGAVCVFDGNANRPEHAAVVHEILRDRDVPAVEVALWADVDEVRRRFVARAEPPLTPDLEPYFEQVARRDRWTVLPPHAVVAAVDTTDTAELDRRYDEILEGVRAALG